MSIKIGLLLILSLTVGCDAITGAKSYTPQMADKHSAEDGEQWTQHMGEAVDLKIVVPQGWETYNTDAGIVLNEHVGSGVPGTTLDGFLVHIFVPYMNRFTLPDSADINMAWAVLKQVVHNPDYVGSAIASEPVAFTWDRYDAAYYLLNNGDQTVTMLLALSLLDRQTMVVCHISTPERQSQRIRQFLPTLLASLTINGEHINATTLNDLPDPLVFPVAEEKEPIQP